MVRNPSQKGWGSPQRVTSYRSTKGRLRRTAQGSSVMVPPRFQARWLFGGSLHSGISVLGRLAFHPWRFQIPPAKDATRGLRVHDASVGHTTVVWAEFHDHGRRPWRGNPAPVLPAYLLPMQTAPECNVTRSPQPACTLFSLQWIGFSVMERRASFCFLRGHRQICGRSYRT
jgi:hypothetical protein